MEKMKKKYSGIMMLWAVLLTLVLSLSYAPSVSAATKSSNVKSVKVTNLPSNTLTLKKGKSMTLKVKVESTNKKKVSQKVTYKSSNTKVATVSNKGKITAKKKGTAKITITSKANTKKNTKITVKVGTPVTSVSLNKTSATVQTGKSITLKATVKPKKPTNKGIVWSSSNSAIATVNSKGKVSTLKAGTVKITAEAADGSGKKKTATITVKDPVVVSEVTVVNAATVKVTLSDASDLTAASFSVKSNKYGGSKYNKVNKVDNISTTDKKTYLVVLDSRSQFYDRDHVQVTVTGLWGTPSSVGTAIFNDGVFKYTDEETYLATVGERFEQEFFGEGYGYKAFAVTNLPKGILYEEVGNYIRFYGKPQQAGNVVTQVVVVDEAENTYTYAITFVIGSEDTITATVRGKKYYLLNAEGIASIGYYGSDDDYYYSDLYARGRGGSGSYKYSLTGNAYGLQISEYSGYISGELRGKGDYTLSIRVEDRNDPNKVANTTVTIHVEQSVTVSGIVKDLGGNPVSGVNIRFINKDKANKFGTSFYTSSDDKGAFSASLVSGTYDIVASCGAGNGETTSYLYSQQLTSTRSGFDLTMAVRKVNIYSDNKDVKANELGSWEDAYGEVYGYGDTLYLKEGKYNLTSTRKSGRVTVTATVAVDTASASATAHVTVNIDDTNTKGTILAGTPINVSLTDDYVYYKFTPTAAGTYYFYFTNISDYAYGALENAEGDTTLTYFSDTFVRDYYCEAGTTYYIRIDGSDSATLNVSATDPQQSDTEEQTEYNSAVINEEEDITNETDVTPEEPADNTEAADETEELTDDAIEVPADVTPEEPADNTEAADETEEPADNTEAVDETEEPAADETAVDGTADDAVLETPAASVDEAAEVTI